MTIRGRKQIPLDERKEPNGVEGLDEKGGLGLLSPDQNRKGQFAEANSFESHRCRDDEQLCLAIALDRRQNFVLEKLLPEI
jgi:hypothetical protein